MKDEAAGLADAVNTRAANRLLLGLATAFFLLEWLPSFTHGYSYFIDELYYLACSRHLAFGYVDHPPMSIFVLRLATALTGESVPALRLVPSLAGAATVFLTGFLARRLGAGLAGQALAAGAAMAAPLFQMMFGFYSMNALEILSWTIAFWVLVEIERRNAPRLWLAFGALAGLSLENKHTFVLLLGALAVAVVLTPVRRHLASRWLWYGAAIGLALLLPNLLWQMGHGWPSLEFYRNADLYKNVITPPLQVLAQQVIFMNPALLPLWVAGLVFFLRSPHGARYRHLGWIFVVLFAAMLVGQKSRPDRIAAAYTILFAGGGVIVSEWLRAPRRRWIVPAWTAAIAVAGAAFVPIALPILPPQTTATYAATLGVVPQIERGEGKRSALPQWLADRTGWEELVDDVEAVAATLHPEERQRAIILAPSYGHAGAIELLGRGRDLPPVYAGQNTYYLWGPPPDPVAAAILMEPYDEGVAEWLFDDVELAGDYRCEWCMAWRADASIWIGRGPLRTFRDAWPRMKHFE